jgi:hypothetical protein
VAKTVNKKIVVVLVLKHAYFHLNSSMYDIQKRSLNEVEIEIFLFKKRHLYFLLSILRGKNSQQKNNCCFGVKACLLSLKVFHV